jgi:hypothetical protein
LPSALADGCEEKKNRELREIINMESLFLPLIRGSARRARGLKKYHK